jgi:hypothetical protein
MTAVGNGLILRNARVPFLLVIIDYSVDGNMGITVNRSYSIADHLVLH